MRRVRTQSVFDGERRRLHTRRAAQLAENVTDVMLDRPLADEERVGDFLVAQSFSHEA